MPCSISPCADSTMELIQREQPRSQKFPLPDSTQRQVLSTHNVTYLVRRVAPCTQIRSLSWLCTPKVSALNQPCTCRHHQTWPLTVTSRLSLPGAARHSLCPTPLGQQLHGHAVADRLQLRRAAQLPGGQGHHRGLQHAHRQHHAPLPHNHQRKLPQGQGARREWLCETQAVAYWPSCPQPCRT